MPCPPSTRASTKQVERTIQGLTLAGAVQLSRCKPCLRMGAECNDEGSEPVCIRLDIIIQDRNVLGADFLNAQVHCSGEAKISFQSKDSGP